MYLIVYQIDNRNIWRKIILSDSKTYILKHILKKKYFELSFSGNVYKKTKKRATELQTAFSYILFSENAASVTF